MQIRYHCPTDRCVAIIEYQPLEELAGTTIECPRCKKTSPIQVTEAMRCSNTVDLCAVCGCHDLFTRKDFPPRLGLAVAVLAGAASLYFLRANFMLSYAILGGAILFDFALYLVIGRLTTCYACRAEYRKSNLNHDHEVFDLELVEKHKFRRAKNEMSQQNQSSQTTV